MVAGIFAQGMAHLRGESQVVVARADASTVACVPDEYKIEEIVTHGGLREEVVVTVFMEQSLPTGELVSFFGKKHKVHLSEPSIARGHQVGWAVKLILVQGA